MQKRKQTKKIICVISASVLLIFLIIYSTCQYVYTKNEVSKSDYVGTYELDPSDNEYITLLAEKDENNNMFYYFDATGEIKSEGYYDYFENNFIVLKNSNNEIAFTIICKEMSFSLVDNNTDEVRSLSKISNNPIVRE